MQDNALYYSKFAVNENPYCVWEHDLPERNLEFIRSVDPGYFEYLAQIHDRALEDEVHKQHAALALRTAYAHSLETLFACLFATLQAPDCVIGWMHRYQTKDIDALIEKVDLGTSLHSKLLAGRVSWEIIADLVLSGFILEDEEKTKHVKLRFAQAWRRFGYDYVHAGLRDEYNSTTHGMRARPGGFRLLMGVEETPGQHAKKMITMADSEFGSTYFVPEKIIKDQKLHFRIKRHWCNWSPEAQIYGLLLAGLSLHNILSFAKTINGIEAAEVNYAWPTDDSLFDSPWNYRSGFAEFNMDTVISAEMIQQYSREEILAIYKRR